MTRDRETAEAELIYGTAERLLEEGAGPVDDTVLADENGVDLASVRHWLDEANGVRFQVATSGETRTVVAPVR